MAYRIAADSESVWVAGVARRTTPVIGGTHCLKNVCKQSLSYLATLYKLQPRIAWRRAEHLKTKRLTLRLRGLSPHNAAALGCREPTRF